MSGFYLPANLIKLQAIIDELQEKISAFIFLLFAIFHRSVRMKRDQYGFGFFVLFVLFCFDSRLFPGPSHDTIAVCSKFFGKFAQSSQLTDNF